MPPVNEIFPIFDYRRLWACIYG